MNNPQPSSTGGLIETPSSSAESLGKPTSDNQPGRDRGTIALWLFVAGMLIGGLIAAYELWAKVTGHAAL